MYAFYYNENRIINVGLVWRLNTIMWHDEEDTASRRHDYHSKLVGQRAFDAASNNTDNHDMAVIKMSKDIILRRGCGKWWRCGRNIGEEFGDKTI